MKTNLIKTALVAVAAAVSLSAQAPTAHAIIPFDFTAAGKVLKAGKYTIELVTPGRVLVIRSAKRDGVMTIPSLVAPADGRPNMTLIFRRYGSEYYLSEVSSGLIGRLALPKTARERKLAAGPSDPVDTVAIAALANNSGH